MKISQNIVQDALKKIVDENPELAWWFQDVAKTVEKLHAKAEKCEALPEGNEKKLVQMKFHLLFFCLKIIIFVCFCLKLEDASKNW